MNDHNTNPQADNGNFTSIKLSPAQAAVHAWIFGADYEPIARTHDRGDRVTGSWSHTLTADEMAEAKKRFEATKAKPYAFENITRGEKPEPVPSVAPWTIPMPAPAPSVAPLDDMPPDTSAEEQAAWAEEAKAAEAAETAETIKDNEVYEATGVSNIEREDAQAEYRPFPLHVLPLVVRRFIEHGMEANQLPDAMIALPTIAMLGAMIGNKRRAQASSTRKEPPVIWAAVICGSGEGKSPALDYALNPIIRAEADASDRHEQALAIHKEKVRQHKHELEAAKKDKTLPKPTDPGEPPVAERFMVGDITLEGLAPILKENARGLLDFRDELAGWFGSHGQYKQGRGSDETNWRSAWQAGPITIDRATDRRHIHVPRAAVSIVGGIQPAAMTKLLRQNGGESVSGGTIPRFLVSMPPTQPTIWKEVPRDHQALADVQQIVRTLLALPWHVNKGKDEPLSVPLSAEAQEIWRGYHDRMQVRRYAEGDELMKATMSKVERYVLRFALIIHECNSADPGRFRNGTIQADEMHAAVTLADWFEAEARRVFATLALEGDDAGGQPGDSHYKREKLKVKLLDIARQNGGVITVRQAQTANKRTLPTAHMAVCMLHELESEGKGKVEKISQSNRETYQLRVTT